MKTQLKIYSIATLAKSHKSESHRELTVYLGKLSVGTRQRTAAKTET